MKAECVEARRDIIEEEIGVLKETENAQVRHNADDE
jgi:hypothetical protein